MGNEPERRLSSRETLPRAQLKALFVWDVVEDFNKTSYILNNGEMIGGDVHVRIAASLFQDVKKPIPAFLATGAVRFDMSSTNEGSNCLSVQFIGEPTNEQTQTLKRAAEEASKIQIDVVDMEENIVGGYTGIVFGEAMQQVRRIIKTTQVR